MYVRVGSKTNNLRILKVVHCKPPVMVSATTEVSRATLAVAFVVSF